MSPHTVLLPDYNRRSLETIQDGYPELLAQHESPPLLALFKDEEGYVLNGESLSYEDLKAHYRHKLSHELPQSVFEVLFETEGGRGHNADVPIWTGLAAEDYQSLLSQTDSHPNIQNLSLFDTESKTLTPISSATDYQDHLFSKFNRKVRYQSTFTCSRPVLWLLLDELPKVSNEVLNAFYHLYTQFRHSIDRFQPDELPHLAIHHEPSCGPNGLGVATVNQIKKGSFVRAYVSHLDIPELKAKDMPYRFIHQSRFGLYLDGQPEAVSSAEFQGNEALLINTAPLHQINLCRETFLWQGLPVTGLFATRDILQGEQLAYPYSGDPSVTHFKWGQEIRSLTNDRVDI